MHTPGDLLIGSYALKRLVSIHSCEFSKERNKSCILIHISMEYRDYLIMGDMWMQARPDEGTLRTLATPTSLFLVRM